MSRRRVAVGVLVLGGLVVGAFAFGVWLTAPTHRITKETFDTLAVGMTADQVVRALRVPAGNYAAPGTRADFSGPAPGGSLHSHCPPGWPADGWSEWMSDAGCVYVQFNDRREVAGTRFYRVWNSANFYDRSFLDRVRDWLGV